jgi:Phage integrase, N-terminal SAM-like domain/Arm DNA-binding domain
MRGHLRERSPGHWAIVLEQRDPSTGKRKRKWHSFKGTKRQAQTECARLIATMKDGTYIEPSKITVAQFLDRWLDHIKSQVTPKSHERYSGLIKKNIDPALGATLLAKLRPANISEAYPAALKNGRKDGRSGGLAPRTVGHIHRVLKQALSQAVKWELLTRNPADAVDPPKVEWKPVSTYDLSETAQILEAVAASRFSCRHFWRSCAACAGMKSAPSGGATSTWNVPSFPLSRAWNKPSPGCASSRRRAARAVRSPCFR